MPDTSIAAAARRVAEHVRGDSRPHHDDLLALLPLLDAVAAGQDGDRVERWARAMCSSARVDPDGRYSPTGSPWWTGYVGRAEQAIALADAEAAARRAVSSNVA